MKYKIVIWGLGGVYNRHVNTIKYFESKGHIEVIALTATRIPDITMLDGYRVVPVESLVDLEYDYIIVMNDVHFTDIVEKALENGISRKQILQYQILEIPDLDFNDYIKLKESRVSIISNNCWAGWIYKTLGMECLSPFKNLFLEDDDYIRLLRDLKGYLSEEIHFADYTTDIHSKKRYPVMRLGDIRIHCNHDDDPAIAEQKWRRRCKKINYQNLFVEMYTEKPEIANQFLAIDQFANKICFVPFKCKHENAMTLQLFPGQTEFWETVISNAGNGNNSLTYNVVELLGMKKNCRYM